MKRIIALALAFCMLLGSVAVAQSDAPYVPGARTRELFMDALSAGKIVSLDMSLNLDMDPMLLADSADEAEIISAVLEAIANAHLHLGMGKAGEGVRLEVGASLDNPNGGAPASMEFAANIDWDGISIESDLMPGQRFTTQWETLLILADADEEMIAAFKELRNIDMNAAVNDFFAELQAELAAMAAALEPYADICAAHFSTWNASFEADVPADDRYPAAAQQLTVTVTTAELAALMNDLLDRLEADGLLNSADLQRQAADLRNTLAQLASIDGVFTLRMGVDENETLRYFAAYVGDDESASNAVFSLVCEPMAEEETGAAAVAIDLNIYTRDGNMIVDEVFALEMIVAVDPSDPVLASSVGLGMTLDASRYGDTYYGIDYTVTTTGEMTEDGLPAAHTLLTETVVSDLTYTVMRTVALADSVVALTADGGETQQTTGAIQIYAGDEAMVNAPIVSKMDYAPDGEGGVSGNGNVFVFIPELGVNQLAYTLGISSRDYDPASTAALEELALEDITEAQLEALGNTLQANLMAKAFAFMAVMPQSVLNVLMAE